MDGWEVAPEQDSVTVVGGGRALLPVQVRNDSADRGTARLAVRVDGDEGGPGHADPHLSRWVLVPGEREEIPAGGSGRFLVLVDPPSDVPAGRYLLRLQLVVGVPGSEVLTDVVRTVPVLTGDVWAVRFAGAVPSSGLVARSESTVTFDIAGPAGASVRVEVDRQAPVGDAGKFPSKFIVDRELIQLPPSGRDTVSVLVVLGTSDVQFRAVLVDAGTGQVVARSEPAIPVFDQPQDPLEPA